MTFFKTSLLTILSVFFTSILIGFSPFGNSEKYLEIVRNSLINELSNHTIYKNEIREDGDVYIEYSEDKSMSEDVVKEYYLIKKESLITGDLNNDGKEDFAIKSIWGPVMSNMWGIRWHIFIQQNEGWKEIENEFGGGKFTDVINISKVNPGQIEVKISHYIEDKNTHSNENTVKKYQYSENKFLIK